MNSKKIDKKVEALLELAGLQGYGDVFPHQLSGGMRQRVALLMTLACEPEMVLLDEPFGSLDTHTKVLLPRELLDIWGKLGQTIVMVLTTSTRPVSFPDRVIVLSSPPQSGHPRPSGGYPASEGRLTIRETRRSRNTPRSFARARPGIQATGMVVGSDVEPYVRRYTKEEWQQRSAALPTSMRSRKSISGGWPALKPWTGSGWSPGRCSFS